MYLIMAFDKPDSAALRLETRPAHVEYVLGQGGMLLGGPFMSDDGETMTGSMLILDTQDRSVAPTSGATATGTRGLIILRPMMAVRVAQTF